MGIGKKRTSDIAGQRFGRLIALEPTKERDGDGGILWLCRCECGNITKGSAYKLRKGIKNSCGCGSRGTHKTDYTGKVFGRLTGIRYTGRSEKNTTVWEWQCECGKVVEASTRDILTGKRSCGCLDVERAIANAKKGREKIIIADGTNVSRIRSSKVSKNNSTGITGVCYVTSKRRYLAYIMFQGKRHQLGFYRSMEEAAAVRKKAQDRMFGEFLMEYERKNKNED